MNDLQISDILVIDDFLEESVFQHLKTELYSNNFPWYYGKHKARSWDEADNFHKYNQQMFHRVYGLPHILNEQQSRSIPLVRPILDKFRPLSILRIKINLQFATEEIYQSPLHIDISAVPKNVKFYTCVYYLNTNNGMTVFEDTSKTVKSKENRIVIFDGTRRHAGTTCTDERTRCVINLNFIPSIETNLEELKNDKLR